MNAPDPAGMVAASQGAAEIVALYQRLRLSGAADLRPWALARMHALVPSPAMAWLGGTLTSRGPVCDDVHLHGLPAAYAAQLQALLPAGPLGPQLFARPGRSIRTGPGDVPPRAVAGLWRPHGIASSIAGVALDADGRRFTLVAWHRPATQPAYTEADRTLHEQLLPHWHEALALQRAGVAPGLPGDDERQRIMRELHDGVGAHLVGLLHLIEHGGATPHALAEAATLALDELRMAVDAAHVAQGDLAALLGSLRYRLQGRLDAAGIAVDWEMPELPPMPALTPPVALQIQRILLEAVTNVLRHARARRISLRVLPLAGGAPTLLLQLRDDGVGLAPLTASAAQAPGTAARGQGLRNMRFRALAIGGALDVGPAPDGPGTLVQLRWPVG